MMKFLIQKIDNKVVHDFSFTLLESIRYQNWLQNEKALEFRYFNTHPTDKNWHFKPYHRHYVPVGSVEFVSAFLNHFYDLTPKPINVPEELTIINSFDFCKRHIFNGTDAYFPHSGKSFIKSNDKIKGTCGIFNQSEAINLPAGNYQFSEVIDIESEWRAFVYQGKLVGLQNYAGDFTRFPNVQIINEMIRAYKSAPVAYTLDVGVGEAEHDSQYGFFMGNKTFVIEVHDFFSCGLYGFADHTIYPNMLYKWFWQYIQREMVEQRRNIL